MGNDHGPTITTPNDSLLEIESSASKGVFVVGILFSNVSIGRVLAVEEIAV